MYLLPLRADQQRINVLLPWVSSLNTTETEDKHSLHES